MMHVLGSLTVLCLAAVPAAQTELPPRERDAFELKSGGRYAAAQSAFVELLRGCRDTAEDAARAEFYATCAHLIAKRTGDFTIAAELDRLAASELARAHPTLRDRALHLRLDLAESAGDVTAVAQLTRSLGYLTQWTIIGPFDNERGGGYSRAYGPEHELALSTSYDGKKRPVQWRRSPVTEPPGGRVDFDTMLRPNDQVLAYAAVALISDRDREVICHLGSDEAIKLFVNGREALGRDVRRAFRPDQDAVPLRLRQGHNLLLAKVCEQQGPFRFALRLRDADGTVLDGVRESSAPADLERASDTEPGEPPRLKPFLGARSLFRAAVDERDDPVAAFRLGYLLALSQPDDPTERRDRPLARIAVAGLDDFSAAHYLLAFTRVRVGSRAEQRDENARRRDYTAILERWPDHVEALRSLAEIEWDERRAGVRAEALLRRALTLHPEFSAGRLLLHRVLEGLELREVADAELARAARADSAGHRHPIAARRWLAALQRQRQHARAEELARELAATDFGAAATPLANLALRSGRRDDALALWRRQILVDPYARTPHRREAELLASEGDLEGALSAWRRWLEICPEDDAALVAVAQLHGRAGNQEQRLELLRTALALNPNRKDERRLLEFLESDETPFFAPYELDAEAIIAADPGPPEDSDFANDAYYFLGVHDVVRAYRNGTISTYSHQVLRVLNQQGAKEYAEYFVPHFWGEQRARLLEVRVIKSDGTEQRPRLTNAFVRMPPIEPGDLIEIRSRVDDVAPSFFGDYFGYVHRFNGPGGAPTHRSRLTLILDPGRDYRFQSRNGAPEGDLATDDSGLTVRSYEMTDLARQDVEVRRPKWQETDPLVRVTTYRDWNHFASWWYNLIRKQSEVSPAIRAKVAELCEGLATERDKIDAIYEFVTTDIRYKAWEFGVHGYKPYTAPVIFDRRHGDCKDKSILMNAMLGAAGIRAFPVLIFADEPRSTDDLSLPMVQHFNHCISYLPEDGDRPAMFLDGTATYHPSDTLPSMDAGARVLVVNGERGEVLDVPWPDADTNRNAREFAIALRESGSAAVKMAHRPTGNKAVGLRDWLGNEPAKRKEKLERQLAQSLGNVVVKSLEVSDLADLNQPVEVRAELECPEFTVAREGGLVLKPSLTDSSLQDLTATDQRRFPLLLGVPESSLQVLRYRLPKGYEPVNLPEPVELKQRFGTFRIEWSFADGEVRVERELRMLEPRIEPPEYPAFREFAIRADQAEARVVVVRRRSR